MKFFFLFSILLTTGLTSAFAKDYPIYRNGNILITGPDSLIPNSGSLCRAVKSANPEITTPSCREEGNFSRNNSLRTYAKWLEINTLEQALISDLATRDSLVKEYLAENRYNHLILIYTKENKIYMALFWGGETYPKEIISYDKNDSRPIEYHITQAFFIGPTERMLSPIEREKQQKEADAYYSEKIIYDTYFTFGIQSIGALSNHSKSGFREYRFNQSQDSSSQFDWTEEEALAYHLSLGKGYAGMFYFGLFGSWSRFEVKYDSSHMRIKDWYYDRYDLGVEAYIGKTYFAPYNFDFFPFLYANFSYTWMVETFDQSIRQPAADLRVKLPTVKGASIAIGVRTLYNSTHGIELAAGLSHRGIVAKEAFNPDPQEEIGGTTNEFWLGAKYWLNFRFRE